MCAMAIVDEIQIKRSGGKRSIDCCVMGLPGDDRSFVEGQGGDLPPASPNLVDCAAVGLIYPAMHTGEDLRVRGKLSADLLFNLKNDIQALLQAYDSALVRVTISAVIVFDSMLVPGPHVALVFLRASTHSRQWRFVLRTTRQIARLSTRW